MNTLTPRQLSTVLAALRLWQDRNLPSSADLSGRIEACEATAREHGPSLDVEEIDALCLQLNAPQVPQASPPFAGTPWRAEPDCDNGWQVQTARDDTPGSRNNYVIAFGITSEAEARVMAASPDLAKFARLTRANVGSLVAHFPVNGDKRELRSLQRWLGEANGALGKANIF